MSGARVGARAGAGAGVGAGVGAGSGSGLNLSPIVSGFLGDPPLTLWMGPRMIPRMVVSILPMVFLSPPTKLRKLRAPTIIFPLWNVT